MAGTVCTAWLFVAFLSVGYGEDMKNSVENVILARQVINEVDLRGNNETNTYNQNKTIEEMHKYVKGNPAVQEMLEEDKADYTEGERKGEEESKRLEALMSAGLIPYMFDRCNRSYTVNHRLMYNVSLQYDVGNNSFVPYQTNGDRIRVAFMKFQDYCNRMNQWTRRLIKGGSFTLKKVERDTFCSLVFKSNYTNLLNNTKLILSFEEDLEKQLAYCLNSADKWMAPHFEKVKVALLKNPEIPEYVPLGKNLQERFIIDCNLYNHIRDKLWNHIMADPGNNIYRKTFKNWKNSSLNINTSHVNDVMDYVG